MTWGEHRTILNAGNPSIDPPSQTSKMLPRIAWAAALFAHHVVAGPYPPDVVDKLAESSLPKLNEYLKKYPQGSCTYETAIKRREW